MKMWSCWAKYRLFEKACISLKLTVMDLTIKKYINQSTISGRPDYWLSIQSTMKISINYALIYNI